MPRIDKVELLAGLLVLAIGAWFYFNAQDYRMGTVMRMGPGYIPATLGLIGMVLGGLIVLTGLARSSELPQFSFRSAGAVLGAIATFALLLERAGLIPAVFFSVLVAVTGNREAKVPFALATATVVSVLCWSVFIAGLGLQMRSFRMPY